MKIVRIRIRNFRCIREAQICPVKHNVLLGPNNTGKTTILEALNLVLNPEISYRSGVIDENDFFQRCYNPDLLDYAEGTHNASRTQQSQRPDTTAGEVELMRPHRPSEINIELVLSGLNSEDEDLFRDNLIPWRPDTQETIESAIEGQDPFENADTAIRVFFEGWYDPQEDDFLHDTRFLRAQGMDREECSTFTREHKRRIGFLIYRDFRALTRPITLDPATLFGVLLKSQEVRPKHFEQVLEGIRGALNPMAADDQFAAVLNAYKAEFERFLSLSSSDASSLYFDLTDRTRRQVKDNAQLYVRDEIFLPIHKMGAGTRSLAILAILTLIMRRRGRGILALEEPETFLFPHAQRRVIDECLSLASQTFVSTHSPHVLERIPVEGVGRIERSLDGLVTWSPIPMVSVKQVNLYSKRLRQVHCEALMGRAAVIVEGDSDRWWLTGASRILNRHPWLGCQQEALELQGICIVSADTDGDVVKLGNFFRDAGLKVVAVFDKTKNQDFLENLLECPFPSLLLRQNGLEDLLVTQLPIEILRLFLTEAPHCKSTPKTSSEVNAMNDKIVREETRIQLIANKGSASMHEWLIAKLDANNLPPTLGDIVYIVSKYVSGGFEFKLCSLMR
jgi:putative ATP-dependent endonuclease of OLD family